MRGSNSKDKASTSLGYQNQANRLTKTLVPPKVPPRQSLNTTQYKLPPSNKRIQSSKNLQVTTKPTPIQQVNFDIQKNMTQSKIFQAKQSLQMLKKKMNRTGMSRQKLSANSISSSKNINNNQKSNQPKQTPTSLKKIQSNKQSKDLQNYQPNNEYDQKSNQTYNKDKYLYQPQPSKTNFKKATQKQKPIMRKVQPRQQEFINQHEEIPIAKKPDFFDLLEKQLQKQAKKSNIPVNTKQMNNYNRQIINDNNPNDEYAVQGELIECSKGCGRQFNSQAIVKHEKICEKVFQSKRKAFDASAHRAPQVQGFNKPPQYLNKINQTKKQPQKQKKQNKVPKWKLQSAEFRASLKAGQNIPLTNEEQAMVNMQKDSLVPCIYCNRKFSDDAAKRHIPYCQNKSKQSGFNGRPSITKKK